MFGILYQADRRVTLLTKRLRRLMKRPQRYTITWLSLSEYVHPVLSHVSKDGLSYVAQRLPKAVLSGSWVVGFMVMLLVMTVAIKCTWHQDTVQDPTTLMKRVEYVLNAHRHQQPSSLEMGRVFVFGNSRPAFGIQSYELARQLGLKKEHVVNLAFPGLGHGAMATYIAKNPHIMQPGRTWIIVVDDDQFLSGDARWQYHPGETLGNNLERLLQSSVLLSYVNTIVDRGHWAMARWSNAIGQRPLASLDYWFLDSLGAWHQNEVAERRVKWAIDKVELHKVLDTNFKQKRVVYHLIEPFRALLTKAQQRGVKLIFLRMPYHPLYYDVRSSMQYHTLAHQNNAVYTQLSRQLHVPFVACAHFAHCQLQLSHFGDPYHLNATGSPVFTHWLAQQVKPHISLN